MRTEGFGKGEEEKERVGNEAAGKGDMRKGVGKKAVEGRVGTEQWGTKQMESVWRRGEPRPGKGGERNVGVWAARRKKVAKGAVWSDMKGRSGRRV